MDKPPRWPSVKEIVGAALERDPSQREAFVNEACGSDVSLRAEVESLLSAHAQAEGLSASAETTLLDDSPQLSKTLGPYRLVKKLGEGGMGQVWLAEQTAPVRRNVALKLIRGGMYDESALRRFQSERQSLAIMDHPAIAKVFDAGATPDGQPYFVMEYVPGVSITSYCDQKKLKIRDRLELFIHACEGVQHAHQKAVIHRDLKPANILVVEVDGKPVPRIIDFGLAKSVTPYLTGDTMQTRIGGFVGTPGFISPEQADPSVLDIDTRTDVYSLGVVLYELLTGALPFDVSEWKKLRLDELLRHLRDDDPPHPSTKVSASRDTSSSAAHARSTEPAQLVSQLRGDLDWITLKAIEKDRNRRYATPLEFAADIRRYLNNEPVAARPASTGYRLRKYVRRNRIAVSVAAGLILLLAGFAILQAVQLRRITRERDRANRVADFMTNMFRVSDPSEARGNSVTAREILDKASKDINKGLAQDPELQANMQSLMGRVYNRLGLYAKAQELLTTAVETRRRLFGPNSPETLAAMVDLANALSDQGKFAEGDKLYQQVIDLGRQIGLPAQRPTIAAMNNLAVNMFDQGRTDEAEKVQRDTIEAQRRLLGPEAPDTLMATNNLAGTLRREGHFTEAEKMDRQLLDTRRRVLGPDHPDTLQSSSNLAMDLEGQQTHLDEAEQLIRSTIELQRRVLGPEHQSTLESMSALARILGLEDRVAEEEVLHRQVLDARVRLLGPEHPKTLFARNNYAAVLDHEHKYKEAIAQFRELFEIQRRIRGLENYNTLLAMTNLAAVLQDDKQFVEAESLGRQALEIERRKLGEGSPVTLEQMSNLSNVLRLLNHTREAETLLQETHDLQAKAFGPDHPKTAKSTYVLAAWINLDGNHDKALALLRQAIDHGLDASTIQGLESDADFKSLRKDPRFLALVAEAHARAAAGKSK